MFANTPLAAQRHVSRTPLPPLSALLFLAACGLPLLAQGAPTETEAWELSPEQSCAPLLTAKECSAHLYRLSVLPEGEARQAYLRAHTALLRERLASCECAQVRERLGLMRH